MKALKAIIAILIPIAVILFFFSLMARIDSHEEQTAIRVWDVVIGLMFAASFVLAPGAKAVRPRATVIVALVIWVMVSGLLVSWHEFQVYARTSAAEYGITRSRILQLYGALTAYARDCGSLPSETQGLDALCENPGLAQWKGPYFSDKEFIFDVWGHRLHYTSRNSKPVVWSCGKDGISGTKDDINMDYEESRATHGG